MRSLICDNNLLEKEKKFHEELNRRIIDHI